MSEAEPLNTCTLRAKTLLIFDYVYIFQSADEFCLYRILDSYQGGEDFTNLSVVSTVRA